VCVSDFLLLRCSFVALLGTDVCMCVCVCVCVCVFVFSAGMCVL